MIWKALEMYEGKCEKSAYPVLSPMGGSSGGMGKKSASLSHSSFIHGSIVASGLMWQLYNMSVCICACVFVCACVCVYVGV